MKNLKKIVIASLFALSLFAVTTAKANLAISNQAWILFIAAGIIGSVVITKSKKNLQPVKVRAFKKY